MIRARIEADKLTMLPPYFLLFGARVEKGVWPPVTCIYEGCGLLHSSAQPPSKAVHHLQRFWLDVQLFWEDFHLLSVPSAGNTRSLLDWPKSFISQKVLKGDFLPDS